ncbi:MAG: hypothetical protein ACYDAN_06630 [Candidatus Limnocylindrales bacterium]
MRSDRRLGRVTAAAAVVAAVLLSLAGCRSGPGPDHYATVLDGVGVPAAWDLVHTTVRSQGGPDKAVDPGRDTDNIDCFEGECPSVTRIYLVDSGPDDVVTAARGLLAGAGFAVGGRPGLPCDAPASGPSCAVTATRGQDYVRFTVYGPGRHTNQLGINDPLRTVVEVIARFNG